MGRYRCNEFDRLSSSRASDIKDENRQHLMISQNRNAKPNFDAAGLRFDCAKIGF